jgi:Spy/CpxP family protein refolding chaperone
MNRKLFMVKDIGLAVGAVALAASLAAGTAFAQAQGRGPFARGIRAALATLDLSQDQKDKVQASFQTMKPQLKALRAKAKGDRQALEALMAAPNPDPAAVGAATLKVHANRQAMRAQMETMRTNLEAILTPEQQANLKGYLAAKRQMRRAMWGPPPAGN